MATNSKPYPKTVGSLKTYADEVGTYPLRALLVAGYVYDDAHEFADDITDELSGSGYARVDLDNVLYTATDSDAAITADDVVFASLTATDIDGVIVISDQGADSASPLVGYYAIGPLSVSTETLTVPWPSGQVAYFTTRDALTGEGIVRTIVAGDNITVDDTDPANPVVSAAGGGESDVLVVDKSAAGSTFSLDLSGSPYDSTLIGKASVQITPPSGSYTCNLTAPTTSARGNLGFIAPGASGSDVVTVNVSGQTFTGTGGVSITLNKADGSMVGPKYATGGAGPVDAEQFDRTSTTPGSISVDLSAVTKAGAAIFVDGASDVEITDLPASSDFPAFFVYVARTSGTGVCTLTFDGGAPVYNGDQYTATSEANGQAAIGLVPLGSGENWLVDSVFPAAGGGGSGDLLAANNLSDLDDAAVARTNLGLGSAAVADTGDFDPAGTAASKVADAINDGTTTVAPSQNAVFDALALKAPIASPALTGSPTAPTQTAADNSTKIATTAYVDTADGLRIPKSLVDAKGDILIGTANDTPDRLAVGTSGTTALADSTQTKGLVYGQPAGLVSPYVAYQSGKLYAIPRGAATSTTSIASGVIRMHPFVPFQTWTFDRLVIFTTATTSGKARLGIFDSDGSGGLPSSLVVDGGEVDTSAGSTVTATISQQLIAGHLYWIGCNVNTATAMVFRTPATYGGTASGGFGFGAFSSDPITYEHATSTQSYGAMPSTLSSPAFANTNTPYIALRA